MTTKQGLIYLQNNNIMFDFIFIDASHTAKDVFTDAILSWDILKENGILGFILPKSILNSSYYMKTRKYIYEKYELLEIIDYGNIKFNYDNSTDIDYF